MNSVYINNIYKDNFFNAVEKAKENKIPNTAFTFEMVLALKEMADHNVYPDGRFSDDHCNIWSMFR